MAIVVSGAFSLMYVYSAEGVELADLLARRKKCLRYLVCRLCLSSNFAVFDFAFHPFEGDKLSTIETLGWILMTIPHPPNFRPWVYSRKEEYQDSIGMVVLYIRVLCLSTDKSFRLIRVQ